MTKLQPVRGTHDILPDDYAGFAHVVNTAREVARLYGYREMATPVFEFTELFARGIGETTDVVSKEMYTFDDRGGESLTLRPEYTAGICRAFVSNGVLQQQVPLKIFLEPQNQHFAVNRGNLPERSMHIFFPLMRQHLIERRRPMWIGELQGVVLLRINERVQALRFFRALPVDHQVPGDGEKPRFKFRFSVVLMAALEHPDPSLLKKVLRPRFVSGNVHEVAEKSVLILFDQPVEQVGIAPLQAARDGFCFIAHQRGKRDGRPKDVQPREKALRPGRMRGKGQTSLLGART